MDLKFYICRHCGNIITKVKDAKVSVMCCGEKMEELIPGTVDAATEKHVPVYEVKDGVVSVKVGSVEHPMLPEHFIEWIAVQTGQGYQLKYLQPGQAPAASFALAQGEQVEGVYAYCNLHGLWKA